MLIFQKLNLVNLINPLTLSTLTLTNSFKKSLYQVTHPRFLKTSLYSNSVSLINLRTVYLCILVIGILLNFTSLVMISHTTVEQPSVPHPKNSFEKSVMLIPLIKAHFYLQINVSLILSLIKTTLLRLKKIQRLKFLNIK